MQATHIVNEMLHTLKSVQLEDIATKKALFPSDLKSRAHSRLWTDHVRLRPLHCRVLNAAQINRHVIPAFYATLQAQEADAQANHAKTLSTHLATLTDAAAKSGPFFLGSSLSYVDVVLAPWLLRLSRVLKPYRGWPDPEEGSRWAAWVAAVEDHEAVKKTTSEDQLYLDSYARYAENRPGTSQVAEAINSGRGLP